MPESEISVKPVDAKPSAENPAANAKTESPTKTKLLDSLNNFRGKAKDALTFLATKKSANQTPDQSPTKNDLSPTNTAPEVSDKSFDAKPSAEDPAANAKTESATKAKLLDSLSSFKGRAKDALNFLATKKAGTQNADTRSTEPSSAGAPFSAATTEMSNPFAEQYARDQAELSKLSDYQLDQLAKKPFGSPDTSRNARAEQILAERAGPIPEQLSDTMMQADSVALHKYTIDGSPLERKAAREVIARRDRVRMIPKDMVDTTKMPGETSGDASTNKTEINNEKNKPMTSFSEIKKGMEVEDAYMKRYYKDSPQFQPPEDQLEGAVGWLAKADQKAATSGDIVSNLGEFRTDIVNQLRTVNNTKDYDRLTADLRNAEKALDTAMWGKNRPAETRKRIQEMRAELTQDQIKNEMYQYYNENYKQALESGNLAAVPSEKISVESVPVVQEYLNDLGIDAKQTKELFNAWNTYNGLDVAKNSYLNTATIKTNIGPSQQRDIMRTGVDYQISAIDSQVKAVGTYIERYSKDEFQSVIDTFGIHNFARYRPEQLHDQFERWQKGQDAAKNVVVMASTDHNGAMMGSAEKGKFADTLSTQLGEEGLFYFEVNDGKGISQVAGEIGKREQSGDRTPSVKNFIISAHASSEYLNLGVDGEQLSIVDYIKAQRKVAEQPWLKTRDYKQELGDNFQVVLQACNTANESLNGENISRAISTVHDAKVKASPKVVHGVVISKDGEVSFLDNTNRPMGATTYSPESSSVN